jgi:hypothetical protein
MFLARIARSFREHDWFTGVVELVLLVVGLFIGFQLDRWNGERLDQNEAEEYRLQLIDDLTIELVDIGYTIAYYEQVSEFATDALAAWDDEPAADAEALIVSLYHASNVLPFSSVRGAFDALANNGLMALVGGPALASRLSAYYGQAVNEVLDDEKVYRMELRGVLPNEVQSTILSSCSTLLAGQLLTEELTSNCDLGLTEAEAQKILADVVAYPRMENYLRQAISRDAVSVYVLSAKRDIIESLLVELRAVGT